MSPEGLLESLPSGEGRSDVSLRKRTSEHADRANAAVPIATARRLTRSFGQMVAVHDLDLEVHQGEVLPLLGHNGAGKTTTLRLFNGVLEPTSGDVKVFGLSPTIDGPAVRARTGVLTESQSLEDRLTARQNLRYYAALYGYPEDRVDDRIDELLDVFDLSDAADRRVGGFSKGMRQKLALARALQHEPELLFLDEPTSGLDPLAARQVTALITELSRSGGRTVVLCTHNLAEANSVADRVAVLREGRLVALGTPAELVAAVGARSRLRLTVAIGDEDTVRSELTDIDITSEAPGALLLSGVSRERVPGMVRALAARDVSVFAIEPQEPTLEEVYFSLYEKDASPA